MKNNESATSGRKSILKSKAGISVLSVGLMFLGANMYLAGENSNYYNKSKSMTSISRNVVLTASATQYGVTTASSLSVRSGAGTNYSVVSSMKKGTKVIMTGKTNNFYRITYGGKTRYISAQYVKITTKPAVVKPPVVKAPQKYISNKCGLSVIFPASWKNKYTVEEDNNGLIVRFKPVGKAIKGEGLLFVIVKRAPDRDEGMLDTIGKRYVTAKS